MDSSCPEGYRVGPRQGKSKSLARDAWSGNMTAILEGGTMRRPLSALTCLLLLLLPLSSPRAAEKRGITEQDLFRFVWIADPQISPDGSRVAYVRVRVDDKKEGYETEIWI